MFGDVMESIRSRRNELDEGVLGTCDCTSYCYFALAVVLFTVGTIITVLALDDGGGHLFSSLGHMWLVGPIFISSGLMVAVKTVLYLRKKNLMALILRQRALLRELQGLQAHQQLMRNASILTLPPAYDLVVTQPPNPAVDGSTGNYPMDCPAPGYSCTQNSQQEEPPPPSYEEAMLLGQQRSLQQSIIVPSESISNLESVKDSIA